jgi:hypothetical protein
LGGGIASSIILTSCSENGETEIANKILNKNEITNYIYKNNSIKIKDFSNKNLDDSSMLNFLSKNYSVDDFFDSVILYINTFINPLFFDKINSNSHLHLEYIQKHKNNTFEFSAVLAFTTIQEITFNYEDLPITLPIGSSGDFKIAS